MRSLLVGLTLCLAEIGLSGCVSATPIALPGGGQGYGIGCGGIQHTAADCYVRAAQVCPGGYDVTAYNQEFVPLLAPFARTMFVRCIGRRAARAGEITMETDD